MHPLLEVLKAAARGEFPAVDGKVTVLPPLEGGLEASVAFTGHALVATAMPAAQVLEQEPDGYGRSLAPDFLRWLAGPSGWIGVIDVTLVARGRGGVSLPRRSDLDQHPRVALGRSLRTDVKVYADERGLVTLANGLAGRLEVSIEAAGGGGLGRALLHDVLGLVPPGELVFAGVTPGNARSLRAFLAAGFVPIGSEVLLRPERR